MKNLNIFKTLWPNIGYKIFTIVDYVELTGKIVFITTGCTLWSYTVDWIT